MTRRVERVMGTVVGVDVRDTDVDPAAIDAALDAAFAQLVDIDARFSPYRADSEVSRYARGEIDPQALAPDLRHVVGVCESLRRSSGGAFDARAAGPTGAFDPSGYVKGWAVEEAAWHLVAAGARRFCWNAGGDVLARGGPTTDANWRVGIRHPDQGDRLAAVVEVRDRAVATSGTYERGGHIIDPRTGRPAHGLRSLTVIGPGLAFADAYATAGFVMGLDGLAWVADHPDHEAIAVTDDGRLVWTPGAERYLVSTAGIGSAA